MASVAEDIGEDTAEPLARGEEGGPSSSSGSGAAGVGLRKEKEPRKRTLRACIGSALTVRSLNKSHLGRQRLFAQKKKAWQEALVRAQTAKAAGVAETEGGGEAGLAAVGSRAPADREVVDGLWDEVISKLEIMVKCCDDGHGAASAALKDMDEAVEKKPVRDIFSVCLLSVRSLFGLPSSAAVVHDQVEKTDIYFRDAPLQQVMFHVLCGHQLKYDDA